MQIKIQRAKIKVKLQAKSLKTFIFELGFDFRGLSFDLFDVE